MISATVLYLDSFTKTNGDSEASDEIGYGITSNEVIKTQLRALGYAIHDLPSLGITAQTKGAWIQETYRILRTISLEDYQLIFIFHAFHQFPSEVRRIVLERGHRAIRIVGYTHGSHWDTSDTYRSEVYPGMQLVDLANLFCMDRVFIVSHYFRRVILEAVRQFNARLGDDLGNRLRVTGLPINNTLIDRYRTRTKPERIQIVFNHSSTVGKGPERFFRVIDCILRTHDVQLVVTRRFRYDHAGGRSLQRLCEVYGDRVILGNTMPLADYYRTLWNSHIQVSTADHESLGISTLEAMYAYNCCVLPNCQSYPEITGDINLYDSDAQLLELLRHYLADRDSREQMAKRMHDRSLRYLPQVIANRVSDELRALLLEEPL
jgi:hypothetical protein